MIIIFILCCVIATQIYMYIILHNHSLHLKAQNKALAGLFRIVTNITIRFARRELSPEVAESLIQEFFDDQETAKKGDDSSWQN